MVSKSGSKGTVIIVIIWKRDSSTLDGAGTGGDGDEL